MKLSIKAFSLAAALVWASGFFFVGFVNLILPPYGGAFLEVMSSIYPGYKAMAGFGNVLVGTLYALLDAAIAGAVFAWLYNIFAK
ncbi:MAG: hypothetical protein OEN50_01660 [Deltaproteobacteria bacterium]|nr:hypothetical protein [Deltaproteobacteria bacterium]